MSGWPTPTVAELQAVGVLLVEDGNHGEHRPRPGEFESAGTAFIRAADLDSGRVRFDEAGRINDAALTRIRKGIGRPGDILFSHKGTVGKLAQVEPDAPPFVCSPQTTFWRVLDQSVLHPAYLYSFMRTRLFIDQWWVRKGDTDMADYVSLTAQRQLRVTVPPLDVQKRIAAPLQAMDGLIENIRRRISLLEQMAQMIYREWFVHFRYPGHEDDELIDSPIGPIPSRWRVVPFSELADFMNGFAFKPAHWGAVGLPIVKIKELKEGITASTPRYDGDDIAPKYRVRGGDLLFSWSAHLDAYLWSGESALLNQHLFKVTPAPGVEKSWLFLTLREEMNEFRSRSQGTTMKHIKRSALGEVSAVTPTSDVMRAFSDVADPAFSERAALSQVHTSLAAMRDLLLPKLVTGVIDVSTLDLDALLEESA